MQMQQHFDSVASNIIALQCSPSTAATFKYRTFCAHVRLARVGAGRVWGSLRGAIHAIRSATGAICMHRCREPYRGNKDNPNSLEAW